MNEIILKGTQKFMEVDIPIVYGGFGKTQKCITDKTIAEIHNQPTREIRRRITDNIKRFKENIDLIDLKQRVVFTHTLEILLNMGYAKQSITQTEHIYVLSERGYAKLVKIMDTDKAWEVHDKIMDEYFQLREEKLSDKDKTLLKIINSESQEEQALALREYRFLIEQPLKEEIAIMAPKANYYDIVLQCKDLIPISVIAKDYGLSAQKLNNILKDKKIQFKQGEIWLLYKKYSNKGYTGTRTHTYQDNKGNNHTSVSSYWTQKGRLFIYELLKKDNILPLIEQE